MQDDLVFDDVEERYYHIVNEYIRGYGGKPIIREKARDVQELHRLYCLAKERSERRYEDVKALMKRITTEIEPDKDGEWEVYFYHPDNSKDLRKYCISISEYGGFSYSIQDVDDPNTRQMKAMVLVNGIEFELGKQMFYLERTLHTNWQNALFGKMWNKIEATLKEKYQLREFRRDRVITLSISGNTYHVLAEQMNAYHTTFKWLGPPSNELLTFNQ